MTAKSPFHAGWQREGHRHRCHRSRQRQPSIYYSERVNKTWSSRTGGRTDRPRVQRRLLCPFYGALQTHSKLDLRSALGHPLRPDYAHYRRGPHPPLGYPFHLGETQHCPNSTFPVTHPPYLLPRHVPARPPPSSPRPFFLSVHPSVRLCKKGAICRLHLSGRRQLTQPPPPPLRQSPPLLSQWP